MTQARTLRLMVLALVLVTAIGSVSCTADDKAMATDFFFAWVSQAEGGSLAALAAIGLSKSDDPTIDAILKAKKVLDDLGRADKKVEAADQARLAGDTTTAETLIREAIEIRPQDYTYRLKLSTLQMENGKAPDAFAGLDMGTLTKMSPKQRLAVTNTAVDEYSASRQRIRAWPPDKRGPDDSAMFAVDKELVSRLASAHRARAMTYDHLDLTDEAAADRALADQYESYNP